MARMVIFDLPCSRPFPASRAARWNVAGSGDYEYPSILGIPRTGSQPRRVRAMSVPRTPQFTSYDVIAIGEVFGSVTRQRMRLLGYRHVSRASPPRGTLSPFRGTPMPVTAASSTTASRNWPTPLGSRLAAGVVVGVPPARTGPLSRAPGHRGPGGMRARSPRATAIGRSVHCRR